MIKLEFISKELQRSRTPTMYQSITLVNSICFSEKNTAVKLNSMKKNLFNANLQVYVIVPCIVNISVKIAPKSIQIMQIVHNYHAST
jgi:hypothetical protein